MISMPHLPMIENAKLGKVKSIPKTDTHMHLFGLGTINYSWLKNSPEINRIFLPKDFIEATKKSNIGKIVFMESGADRDYSLKEVHWVMEQAKKDGRIKGIVAKGHLDEKGAIEPDLDALLETGWVKGLRAGINPELLKSQGFTATMNRLAKHQLSFDLLTGPNMLSEIAKTVKKTPDTVYILDHLGNPNVQNNGFETWKKGIAQLAAIPNVNCKISGIITRAGKGWTVDMLKPYVHEVIEQFGFDRIVYGGDWPVVLRAGSYHSWAKAFEKLTKEFSENELKKLYHLNADRIYNL